MRSNLHPDFSSRASDLELMDDLNCSGEVVIQTLHELDIINRWLGGNRVTLDAVAFLLKKSTGHTVTIADLGCGSGDMLKRIAEYGRRHGISMRLTGIDANPNIIAFARAHSLEYPEIQWEAIDVMSPAFREQKFDVVIGTLFFHHFDQHALQSLMKSLIQQVNIGIIINDIHRHWLAYHSIKYITRLFSSSRMVQYDAPLSVRRAFVKEDWISLFASCGIIRYFIRWKWAFRWKIIIHAG